jgi:hypothetical protein
MPTPDEPTRRDFEHLARTVTELSATIKELQTMMTATYVRKDVYERDQVSHDHTHQEQQKDIDGLVGWKEWALRIVVGAVMLGLIGLLAAQR